MELKIKIYNMKDLRMLTVGKPGSDASLVYGTEYKEGDCILVERNDESKYCVVQLEDSMPPALIYMDEKRMPFYIPDPDKRSCYSPKSFTGTCHLLRARAATEEEMNVRRNLAFNPYDCGREIGCYPHASSSVEAQSPAFAARNAIDGIFENNSHGEWPYQAWGINKNPEATWKLDFGRLVTLDELRLTLRADFPHDNWWHSVTVEFSDGSKEVLSLVRTEKTQSFPISPRTVRWLELKELKIAENGSEFPALTQFEAYGTEKRQDEEKLK